jgi:hypothetical protein
MPEYKLGHPSHSGGTLLKKLHPVVHESPPIQSFLQPHNDSHNDSHDVSHAETQYNGGGPQ